MSTSTELADLRATATSIGFDSERQYAGYGAEIFSYFILEDPKVMAEFEKNWQREVVEVGGDSHPDHVLAATLESFSDLEKAGIRLRAQIRMEKWNGEPTRKNISA